MEFEFVNSGNEEESLFFTILDEQYMLAKNFINQFASVNWIEPWLVALLFFHLLVTSLTLLTRRHATFQMILFLFTLALVSSASSLNKIGADNWEVFAGGQYFDSDGRFISIVFSLPLLFNAMLMLANWLLMSSQLMTSIRRLQLQQRARKLAAAESSNKKNK